MQETSAAPAEEADIEQRIRALAPWFHNIELQGIQTAPDHFLGDYPRNFWKYFEHAIPKDLTGKSVLDIGCNAGFFSLEMKKRGAARVVGMDHDPRYLAQAKLATELSGLEVELRDLDVYDVAELGQKFDVVLFMGVLYHLRHPLLALDLIWEHVASDLLIFQCMLRGSDGVMPLEGNYPFTERALFDQPEFPKLHFVENEYADDNTNWWIPNRACAEAMLRSSGFTILERVASEIFICKKGPRPRFSRGAAYPARGRSH